jgi:hypothetical protein
VTVAGFLCSGWILIVRPEPPDEAALFLGGAFVIEGDKATEKCLFQRLSLLAATGEEVGKR